MATLLFGIHPRSIGSVFRPTASFLRYTTKSRVPLPVIRQPVAEALAVVPRRGGRRVGTLLILSSMGLAYFQLERTAAQCAAGGGDNDSPNDLPSPSDLLAKVLEQYQCQVNEMGVSGLVGICSGYCLKRVSQEVAVGIGAVFMLLQILQHMGYIHVNYKKINADVTKKLDMDGDGKLTQSDFKVLIDNFTSYFSEGLPSATGFAAGFSLGFYYA